MKVLVTNDDGVSSPGLHALVRELASRDLEVIVVAPDKDRSGAGAGIGGLHRDRHIDAEEVELPGAEDVPAYAMAGMPALCVLAARLGGFGDSPDLVVSGINPGCNTGRAVLHSGTVGAALTAANFGMSGLAVSIEGEGYGGADRVVHWSTAATVAADSIPWLAEAPRTTVLNINSPDLPLDEVKGVRWAELAPFGTVRTSVLEPATAGGRLQMAFLPTDDNLPPESDTALVQAGYVAVTTITGIQATEPIDVAAVVGTPMEGRRTA